MTRNTSDYGLAKVRLVLTEDAPPNCSHSLYKSDSSATGDTPTNTMSMLPRLGCACCGSGALVFARSSVEDAGNGSCGAPSVGCGCAVACRGISGMKSSVDGGAGVGAAAGAAFSRGSSRRAESSTLPGCARACGVSRPGMPPPPITSMSVSSLPSWSGTANAVYGSGTAGIAGSLLKGVDSRPGGSEKSKPGTPVCVGSLVGSGACAFRPGGSLIPVVRWWRGSRECFDPGCSALTRHSMSRNPRPVLVRPKAAGGPPAPPPTDVEAAVAEERKRWEAVLATERQRMDVRCENIMAVLREKDATIADLQLRLDQQRESSGSAASRHGGPGRATPALETAGATEFQTTVSIPGLSSAFDDPTTVISLRKQVDSLHAAIAAERQVSESLRQALAVEGTRCGQLEGESSSAARKVDALQAEIASLKSQLDSAQREVSDATARDVHVSADVSQLSAQHRHTLAALDEERKVAEALRYACCSVLPRPFECNRVSPLPVLGGDLCCNPPQGAVEGV